MRRILLIACVALASTWAAAEQDELPSGQADRKQPEAMPDMPLKARQEMERKSREATERTREAQKRRMEILKKNSPEAAAQFDADIRRAERMNELMTMLHEGKISQERAEKEIFPLMKPLMKDELARVEQRIARLKKELDFLRQVQKDPDLLVRRRVEEMMGKRPLEDVPAPSPMGE